MIASLTDKDGKILIPHYEDDIIPPTKEELESYKSLGMTEEIFRNDGGVLEQVKLNVPEDEILLSLWRRPSIIVSTIESGSRVNAGNVLQDSAYARIGIRLAPGMDAVKCTDMLADFLKAQVPNNMEITIDKEDGANPFTTDTNHPFFKKMSEAMADAYASPTKFIFSATRSATSRFCSRASKTRNATPMAKTKAFTCPISKAASSQKRFSLHLFRKEDL